MLLDLHQLQIGEDLLIADIGQAAIEIDDALINPIQPRQAVLDQFDELAHESKDTSA